MKSLLHHTRRNGLKPQTLATPRRVSSLSVQLSNKKPFHTNINLQKHFSADRVGSSTNSTKQSPLALQTALQKITLKSPASSTHFKKICRSLGPTLHIQKNDFSSQPSHHFRTPSPLSPAPASSPLILLNQTRASSRPIGSSLSNTFFNPLRFSSSKKPETVSRDVIVQRINMITDMIERGNIKPRFQVLDKIIANADSEFYTSKNATKQIKEHQSLSRKLDMAKRLESLLNEYDGLIEFNMEEKSPELSEEADGLLQQLAEETDEFYTNLLMSNKTDQSSCYLELQAGAGGTDSQDWTEMLLTMYQSWAERQAYQVESLDLSSGQEAGLRSAIIKVDGEYAYGWLKGETGVHRLIRNSPFNKAGLRHTSFASVFVSPVLDEDEPFELNMKDLRIDTFLSSGPGGQNANKTESAVRVTHLPTGITAKIQTTRSQHTNKAMALEIVRARLFNIEMAQKQKEAQEAKSVIGPNSFGSQIRTYTLHPYQLVKDARSRFETANVDEILKGGEVLDEMLKSSLSL